MADDSAIDDVLTSLRILEANGIVDFNGHVRVRRDSGCLINSGRVGAQRADDATTSLPLTLTVRSAPGVEAPPMEIHIHTEIYRAPARCRRRRAWASVLVDAAVIDRNAVSAGFSARRAD